MAVGKKYDYPPLLAPGRHFLSIDEIHSKFLSGPLATEERRTAFNRFDEVVKLLTSERICCEVWLDGSFLTEKPDPKDTDVTVILEREVSEKIQEDQKDLLNRIENGILIEGLDSFLFVRLKHDDNGYGDDELDPAYSWGEQYGSQHDKQYLKGFVVLRLGENHVGLRLCC